MKNLRDNSFALLISEMRGRVNVIDASRLKSSFYCYVLHEISLNIGLCHTLSAYWYFWYFTAIKQSCEIIWMHNFSVNLEILFCAFLAVWSFQFYCIKSSLPSAGLYPFNLNYWFFVLSKSCKLTSNWCTLSRNEGNFYLFLFCSFTF